MSPPALQEALVSTVSSQPSGGLAFVTWGSVLGTGPWAKANVTSFSTSTLRPLWALRAAIGGEWLGLVDSGYLSLQALSLPHVPSTCPLTQKERLCPVPSTHPAPQTSLPKRQ